MQVLGTGEICTEVSSECHHHSRAKNTQPTLSTCVRSTPPVLHHPSNDSTSALPPWPYIHQYSATVPVNQIMHHHPDGNFRRAPPPWQKQSTLHHCDNNFRQLRTSHAVSYLKCAAETLVRYVYVSENCNKMGYVSDVWMKDMSKVLRLISGE
jgi:hypothetical protein